MPGLVKNTTFLALALVVQTLAGLVGQPILNSSMTPDQRGLVMLLVTLFGLSFDLLHLGSGQAAIFRIAAGSAVWSVLSIEILWSLAIAGALLAATPLLRLLDAFDHVDQWVLLLGWMTVLARVVAVANSGTSARNRYDVVAASGAFAALLMLAARLLWVPHQPLEGELMATAIGVSVAGLPSLLLLIRTERFVGPNLEELRQLITFSFRSMGGRIFELLSGRGLPLIMVAVLGTSAVGVYVAMRAVPTILITGAGLVARPLFSRSASMSDEEARELVAPLLRVTLTASVLVSATIALTAPLLVSLLAATEYEHATLCLQLIVLQVPARAAWVISGAHLSGTGRPELESRAIVFGTMTSFALAAAFGLLGSLPWLLLGEFCGVLLTTALLLVGLRDLRGIPLRDMLWPRREDASHVRRTLAVLRSTIRST